MFWCYVKHSNNCLLFWEDQMKVPDLLLKKKHKLELIETNAITGNKRDQLWIMTNDLIQCKMIN